MQIREIMRRCDHTLLRRDATAADIIHLCEEGLRFGVASVCVPPCHVAGVKGYVGDRLKITTVVGFPNGCNTPKVKAFEAQDAIRNGADEIDMVINLSMVKDACWESLLDEIKTVRAFTQGHILKVIAETCLLTEEEKRMVCQIVSASGADYIKTSTGFSTGGATAEDVKLLRACCGGQVKIKASGGIATLQDAAMFLEIGADRIGASRLAALAAEMEDAAAPSAPAEQPPADQAAQGAAGDAQDKPV